MSFKSFFFIISLILIFSVPAFAGTATINMWGTNTTNTKTNTTISNGQNNTIDISAWNTGSGIKTFRVQVYNSSDTLTFQISNVTASILVEVKINGSAYNAYQTDSNGIVTFTRVQGIGNQTYDVRPATNIGGNNATWGWFWNVVIKNGTAENFNIISGTQINVTTLNATNVVGNGSQLYGLNVSNATVGTLASGRLSADVVLANQNNYNVTLINSTIDMRNSTVNDTGLVLDMRFNENSTGTATSTRIYDSSKYANDGTWNGNTVPNWTSGMFGGGLQLDGVNDYVDVGNSASLNINNNFTIVGWIKPPAGLYPTSDSALIGKMNAPSTLGYMLYFGNNGVLRIAADNTAYLSGSLTPLSDGNWHYISGVKSGTSGHIYLDGIEVSGTGTLSESVTSVTNNLFIGTYLGGAKFNGTIDEVRIYNRALSANEVRALYYSNPLSEKSSFIQANSSRFIDNGGNLLGEINTTTTWFGNLTVNGSRLYNLNASNITIGTLSGNVNGTWIGYYPTINTTTNTTLTTTDNILIASGTGTQYISLPAASINTGKIFNIKKKLSGGTTAINASDGGTIDGGKWANITTQYNSVTVVSDGTEWNII